jgi:hypothetical protein
VKQDVLLHRAWLASQRLGLSRLIGGAATMFWLEIVVEIHRCGDGISLGFGRRGDAYRSRSEFVKLYGFTDADLALLIERGLLVELEDGGVALPDRWGLRPKERAIRPARAPFRPIVVDGGNR